MQIKAQALVTDTDTEAAMKLHMPAIRHHLLMLFSDLDKEAIDSAEEKEKLTTDALETIRMTLKERGAADRVTGSLNPWNCSTEMSKTAEDGAQTNSTIQQISLFFK